MSDTKGYSLLSVSSPTDDSIKEVFVILQHEDGHTLSGWIHPRRKAVV